MALVEICSGHPHRIVLNQRTRVDDRIAANSLRHYIAPCMTMLPAPITHDVNLGAWRNDAWRRNQAESPVHRAVSGYRVTESGRVR